VVQGCRNSSHRVATLAETDDFVQHGLFGRIGLDVLPVGAEPIAELDVAHPLSVAPLVAHGVTRALTDRGGFDEAESSFDNVQREKISTFQLVVYLRAD
jgi:hypothetical protein